jgi:urease accessory protein
LRRDAAPGLGLAEIASGSTHAAGAVRWPASLQLRARAEQGATRVHAAHEGPLRLLKTLHPEGAGIAHAVLVHPPGGLVGGDRLEVDVEVGAGAHLLVTTPAATRFYRSVAGAAAQVMRARVAAGARLEWLPQETIAYAGCDAHNRWAVELEGDAAVMAMEVLALGLPRAGRPFGANEAGEARAARGTSGTSGTSGATGATGAGRIEQAFEITTTGRMGLWRERGVLDAADRALLEGPCGLAGRRVLGSLLLASGAAFESSEAEAALEEARAEIATVESAPSTASPLLAGATGLHGRVLLVRALADDTESVMHLLRRVRARWRERLWRLPPCDPRIWSS